ncbi:MAG: hypothetical protein GWN18_09400, partial [Thermoplasmata archaeon]|nr:hypothetical protein [Thermoplasmata archaeon]NIT77508.1 hypothetical protein [Thermoplasmata archaeon]NIU49272.1 hypothetical protein [Thermoplasmata archaeon]NIV78943.1 hypothetical protein [Thermoplasmata archaeon]NIW82769.1 hypothetical protein [Thermoplasmata archaeon]
PSNHVTVWVGNRSFNQPKRYDFKNILFFSNGKLDPLNPDATTLLFRHNFRGPQVDIAEEERRGSDGNMWSRYTVEIPSGIDRENMSLAFVNYYDTWIVFDR